MLLTRYVIVRSSLDLLSPAALDIVIPLYQNARNNIQSIVIVMDSKELINRLSVLSANYHAVQNDLSNQYHFDQLRDVRINVFRYCALAIDSTYIIILVRSYHLFEMLETLVRSDAILQKQVILDTSYSNLP